MSFRLVPKSVTLMTLNGVMVVTLRCFTKFGKPAFHHITTSPHVELTDQTSASIIHIIIW